MKEFIADLARPYAIIITATAASIATVKIAWAVSDGNAGAIYMGAVFAGVGALVGVRAWENVKGGQASAEVEKVRAAQSPPPTQALLPPDTADSADSGELPADQRVQR